MENQILETLRMLDQDKITNKDLMWEYLKCKISTRIEKSQLFSF